MKTTIEMHGFEIVIEETEAGLLTVSALKDGEVVEEFSLEGGEDHPGMEGEEAEAQGEEIKGFGEFGQGEEEDFEGEEDFEDEEGEDLDEVQDVDDEKELEGEEDLDEEDEDEEEEAKLESFQSFINKKRK
jgi:hypothetical protein